MKKINVRWNYEGKVFTGYVEFTQEGDEIRVSASDNDRHHCFYNEVLTESEANDILENIIINDYNITNVL